MRGYDEKTLSIWEKEGQEVKAVKLSKYGEKPLFMIKFGETLLKYANEMTMLNELTNGEYEFVDEVG